jgi:hypothetical protein
MATLLSHESTLQEKIEEVTAPLTDMLDTLVAVEDAEDADETDGYRAEIRQQASDALAAWDTIAAALRKAVDAR